MGTVVNLYKGTTLLYTVSKDLNKRTKLTIRGLTTNTTYPKGTYKYTWKTGTVETNKIDIPAFSTGTATEVDVEVFDRGLCLDISRRFYPVDAIKQIVDTLYTYGANYLQLHFSDDQRYGIYSTYLQQTSTTLNNYDYLTKTELDGLIKYCNDRGIMVVPDFDVPGHSYAWLDKLSKKDPALAVKVRSDFEEGLVDYFGSAVALAEVKKMFNEVATVFKQPMFDGEQRMSIGGDEVPASNGAQDDYINFLNQVGRHVTSLGYRPFIWNDCLTPYGLSVLDLNIDISYWRQSSTTGLTVFDMFNENKDRGIYNYNFYSLVYNPKAGITQAMIDEQAGYIDWAYRPNSFCYRADPYTEEFQGNIKGVCYTIWSEDAVGVSDAEVLKQINAFLKAYLS